MVRMNMNPQNRYLLRSQSRTCGNEYYHESGTQAVGTPDEQEYVNWTRYLDVARGFRTIKEAKSMANLLWSKYGLKVIIVDHYGEAAIQGIAGFAEGETADVGTRRVTNAAPREVF